MSNRRRASDNGGIVPARGLGHFLHMKAPALLLLPLLAATLAPAATAKKAAPVKDETCEVGLPLGKYSEKSIFRVPCSWTNDAGENVKLNALAGKPVVIAMFFTNCVHSCPMIARDMRSIQNGLSSKAAEKAQFVLVSIDPERDTREALAAFRKKNRLTGTEWTLLTGKPECVKQLADRLGFVFAPGSKLQFAHSLLITVLNGAGEVAHQQTGLGVDRHTAIETVEKLAAAKNAR